MTGTLPTARGGRSRTARPACARPAQQRALFVDSGLSFATTAPPGVATRAAAAAAAVAARSIARAPTPTVRPTDRPPALWRCCCCYAPTGNRSRRLVWLLSSCGSRDYYVGTLAIRLRLAADDLGLRCRSLSTSGPLLDFRLVPYLHLSCRRYADKRRGSQLELRRRQEDLE